MTENKQNSLKHSIEIEPNIPALTDPYRRTKTEKEWLDDLKKDSIDSYNLGHAALHLFKFFVKDVYSLEFERALKHLKTDYDKLHRDPELTLRWIAKFMPWLKEPHPGCISIIGMHKVKRKFKGVRSSSVRQYRAKIRNYFWNVVGVKISEEELGESAKIREDLADEALVAPTKEIAAKIIGSLTNHNFKTACMLAGEVAIREGEIVQLRKKHFDLTKDPPEVFLPNSILKRKKSPRRGAGQIRYLPREVAAAVKIDIRNLAEDDLVYGSNSNPRTAKNNIRTKWAYHLVQLGLDRKYKGNKRFVHNFHSLKALCQHTIQMATKDAAFANVYCDHESKEYLPVYNRYQLEEIKDKFREAESNLQLFENLAVVNHTDEKVKKMEKALEELRGQFFTRQIEVGMAVTDMLEDPEELKELLKSKPELKKFLKSE